MADLVSPPASAGSGGNAGGQVSVNGVLYKIGSPEYYAALHAEALRQSTAGGTAAGSSLKAASDASGVPLTGSTTTITGSRAGGPAIPSPSLAGLNAAVGSVPGSAGGASGTGPSSTARLAPVDTTAAETAAFGSAKDQVGQEASGALTGLRSALGSRGMLGSGLEERGTAAAATSAAGQLGDVSRQQAVTRADLAQKNAETNFQGDITQRGQDIQKEEAGNSLAGSLAESGYAGQITQRGQDISAANASRALDIESAQLGVQQRTTALAGLEAALKVTSASGLAY